MVLASMCVCVWTVCGSIDKCPRVDTGQLTTSDLVLQIHHCVLETDTADVMLAAQ